MAIFRNLLTPLCLACGMILAGHLLSQKVDFPDAASTAGGGVRIYAEDQAELQRSNIVDVSGQAVWPEPVPGNGIGTTVSDTSIKPEVSDPGVAINIGDNVNADEPYLLRPGSSAEINLGARVEVHPPVYPETQGAPQNLGEPIDADCLDCVTTDGPVEYRNIGPEISLEEYYQVEDPAGSQSRNIGPDMQVESYLAGQ